MRKAYASQLTIVKTVATNTYAVRFCNTAFECGWVRVKNIDAAPGLDAVYCYFRWRHVYRVHMAYNHQEQEEGSARRSLSSVSMV